VEKERRNVQRTRGTKSHTFSKFAERKGAKRNSCPLRGTRSRGARKRDFAFMKGGKDGNKTKHCEPRNEDQPTVPFMQSSFTRGKGGRGARKEGG